MILTTQTVCRKCRPVSLSESKYSLVTGSYVPLQYLINLRPCDGPESPKCHCVLICSSVLQFHSVLTWLRVLLSLTSPLLSRSSELGKGSAGLGGVLGEPGAPAEKIQLRGALLQTLSSSGADPGWDGPWEIRNFQLLGTRSPASPAFILLH